MAEQECWVPYTNDSRYFDDPEPLINEGRLIILDVDKLYLAGIAESILLTEAIAEALERNSNEVVVYVDDGYLRKKRDGVWVIINASEKVTEWELERLGIKYEDGLIRYLPEEYKAIEIYDGDVAELIIFKSNQRLEQKTCWVREVSESKMFDSELAKQLIENERLVMFDVDELIDGIGSLALSYAIAERLDLKGYKVFTIIKGLGFGEKIDDLWVMTCYAHKLCMEDLGFKLNDNELITYAPDFNMIEIQGQFTELIAYRPKKNQTTKIKLADGEKIIKRYMTFIRDEKLGLLNPVWVYEIKGKDGKIRVEMHDAELRTFKSSTD